MNPLAIPNSSPVRWLHFTAIGGLGWNAFGIFQFVHSVTTTEAQLIAGGLTAEQASVLIGYPSWMTVAFAIGVFGGFTGSALLLVRRRLAEPVLMVSLAAYVALWLGDAFHGVFAALGVQQVIIITLVVAIATGLSVIARISRT